VLIRSVILFLSVLNASFCGAQTLPYQGDLEETQSKLFEKIEKADETSSNEAIKFCSQLITKSNGTEANTWANLIYASLLAESDSVAKANRILSDSANLDLVNADQWIRNYHSLCLSSIYELEGEYFKAENLLRPVVSNNSLLELQLLATMKLAEVMRYQGKLDVSKINWLEALQMSIQLADSSHIADCHRGRGIVYFLLDRIDDAKTDIQVYRSYNRRIGNRKNEALGISLLGLIDYQKRNYEEAISKALDSYNIRKEINDLKGQGESLNNLALGYMGLNNWQQALRYLEEAVQMKTLASDLSQMTVILNNMGHCHKRSGNPSEAERYFLLALEKGWQNGQMGDVVISYKNLVGLKTQQKKFEEAVSLQSRLINLKDSLAEVERKEAISELEVRFETGQKEQEIKVLQQQQTIITNRWLTLALGLFLTIVIGALIFDNQKRKYRQEHDLLTAEDDLQKAELKIMSDLLEHNQQKLSLYTENLLKKNELVSQLEKRLKSAVEKTGNLEPETSELLVNFSGVRILTDDDWEEFKQLFDGVHRGMLERLLDQYENLTLAEQRLFLLMKLDMSTKEIANILGVSPDSVKKGRYRLKKKINIPDEVSLQDFVSSF
jgi:tetratricopeptide (TPR) repeat protein